MKALVLGSFVGESSEELTLEAGLIVDVLVQSDDGWWDIQYGDQIGIFPITYLRLIEEEGEEDEEEVEEVVEELEEEIGEDEEIVEVIEEIIEVDDMEDGDDEIIEERITYIEVDDDYVPKQQEEEQKQNEIEENNQTEEIEPQNKQEEQPKEEQPQEEQQINEEQPKEEQPQEENNVETEVEQQPQQQEVEIEQKPLRSLPPIGGAANRGQPVGPQRGNFNPNAQRGGAPINRGGSPGARPLPAPNSPQRGGGVGPVRGSAPPRGGQTPSSSGSLPRGQPISRGVSPNTPPRGGASSVAPSSPANNNNVNNNNRGSPQVNRGGPGNRLSNNNLAGRALPSPGSQQPPQQQVQSQVPSNNGTPPANSSGKVLSRRAAPTSNRTNSLSTLVENIDINDEEKNNNNNNNNINMEEIKEENNGEIIENNNQETPAADNNNNDVNNDVEMSDDERSKLEQHRRNVVDEIITTERDYIADLEIVVKVFINPLQEKGLISRDDIQTLFSNLSVILSVNKEVARLFETRSDEEKDGPLLVGDIFLKMADFFKMYTTYCANQPKALSALDRLSKTPAFAEFLQESLLNPETRALTLFSFLIKPIQRICKYPLLLRDLLKHTEKNHPDYANLDNALNKINDVVEYVNERKRLAENLQKILEIQNQIEDCPESLVSPSRRFMREGTVNVFEKGRRQQRKMFVFNDLIVLTKEQKSLMGNALKDHFKGKFHLNEVKLVEMADTNDVIDACEVRPKDPKEKPLILVFASTAEKRAWLKEVKMLVREFQKKEAQAAKEALLKKAEEGENGTIMPDFTPSSSDSPKSAPRNSLRNTMPNMAAVSPAPPLVKQNSIVKAQPPAGHKAPGQRATPPPPPPTKKSGGSSIFGKKSKDKKEEKSESPKQKKIASPLVTPSKLNNQFSKELAKTLQKKQ